ncbi:nucleotide exchange factor GrpE [Lujinxingia litoralis]|uniref:Protein GrpE n=1 Tax=Lujinxingia litoralis TaxID=2211119 RepID=A0A328C1W5_9DELT|nr:nucleotide exchange factor GrpE [Lujinxingia litoralis]RAL20587.1 nucleotide exchange factor GrpE [Lujinxingia litoralis]
MRLHLRDLMRRGSAFTQNVLDALVQEVEELRARVKRYEQTQTELQDALRQERLEKRALEQRLRQEHRESERLREELHNQRPRDTAEPSPPPPVDHERAALEKQIALLIAESKALQERVGEASEQASQQERVRLLRGLGELMDSLGRAIQHSEGPMREGLLGIEAQFVRFLRDEGVELLGKVGEPLNPWLHQAVDVRESEALSRGQIVEVVRPGFRLSDGTVLRHAEVVVAS